MSKPSNFEILTAMAKAEKDIHMMPPNNFMESFAGTGQWGFVKMAVPRELLLNMAIEEKLECMLFVFDREQYDEVSLLLESKNQAAGEVQATVSGTGEGGQE